VDAVIETVLRIDGTTAEIIGPGNPGYRDALLQRAADFGLRHRIRAMTLDRAALRQRYLAADALLFTSLHEPFGLVPIEAMACGTPVVASGAGGSAEFLVDEENCLLYPAGDFDALASTVRRLSSDDGLRLRLARNGLRVAHEFSVDRLADRLERAHLEAVEASGGARNSARIR
jgi:glycosyltransferase involved in cell wall biosynthesis